MEYFRTIFHKGYNLWGDRRSSIQGEFCGLPPYEGYQEDDFPVSEILDDCVISINSYIEPKPGFVAQLAATFNKEAHNLVTDRSNGQ